MKKKQPHKIRNDKRTFLLAILGTFAVIIYLYMVFGQLPQAEVAHEKLDVEFSKIPPLAQSTETYHASGIGKGLQVSVGGTYKTSLSYAQIKDYYVSQMQLNGWRVVKEEGVTESEEDLGGKSIIFEKDQYYADLNYTGERTKKDFTYSFWLRWSTGPFGN